MKIEQTGEAYVLDDYESDLVNAILHYMNRAGKKSREFCNNMLNDLMYDILENRKYDHSEEEMKGNVPEWGEDYASIVISHSEEAQKNAEEMFRRREEILKRFDKNRNE